MAAITKNKHKLILSIFSYKAIEVKMFLAVKIPFD